VLDRSEHFRHARRDARGLESGRVGNEHSGFEFPKNRAPPWNREWIIATRNIFATRIAGPVHSP
jgi:hypothetical protein